VASARQSVGRSREAAREHRIRADWHQMHLEEGCAPLPCLYGRHVVSPLNLGGLVHVLPLVSARTRRPLNSHAYGRPPVLANGLLTATRI
jgi:hypothetical protein